MRNNVPDPIAPPVLATRLALSKAEAAAVLGLSDRLIDDMVLSGELPHAKAGRRVLIPVDALRAWLAARTTGGVAVSDGPDGGASDVPVS